MSEPFLEEQIKRIRELSARISGSERRRDEVTRLLERTRSGYSPLEEVRDFTPCENTAADDPAPHRREPLRRRQPARARKRRRR